MNVPTSKKILVVDDEPDVTDLLGYQLSQAGYTVEIINDPLLIIGTAHSFMPSLVILDIMMPNLDGLQICRMLRADPKLKAIPIIFLTAKGEADDRIKGLETGADDYVCKPFDSRELLLRVRALFKRSAAAKQPAPSRAICVGNVWLDADKHEIKVNDQKVELTATEFKLLQLLMERKGRVQSRDNLLINVWNYETDIETRTVDTHVRRLREKLGPSADIIETVRGVGYRITEI